MDGQLYPAPVAEETKPGRRGVWIRRTLWILGLVVALVAGFLVGHIVQYKSSVVYPEDLEEVLASKPKTVSELGARFSQQNKRLWWGNEKMRESALEAFSDTDAGVAETRTLILKELRDRARFVKDCLKSGTPFFSYHIAQADACEYAIDFPTRNTSMLAMGNRVYSICLDKDWRIIGWVRHF